jgi:hypothetical protein
MDLFLKLFIYKIVHINTRFKIEVMILDFFELLFSIGDFATTLGSSGKSPHQLHIKELKKHEKWFYELYMTNDKKFRNMINTHPRIVSYLEDEKNIKLLKVDEEERERFISWLQSEYEKWGKYY